MSATNFRTSYFTAVVAFADLRGVGLAKLCIKARLRLERGEAIVAAIFEPWSSPQSLSSLSPQSVDWCVAVGG